MAKNENILPEIPPEEMHALDRGAFNLVRAGWGLQEAYVHMWNLRDIKRPAPIATAAGESMALPFEGGEVMPVLDFKEATKALLKNAAEVFDGQRESVVLMVCAATIIDSIEQDPNPGEISVRVRQALNELMAQLVATSEEFSKDLVH